MAKEKKFYEIKWNGQEWKLNRVTVITGCAMKWNLLGWYGKHGNKKAKQMLNDASTVGTDTHNYIEAYFLKLKKIDYKGDINKIRNCISNFKLLVKKYKLEPISINGKLALETTVYSLTYLYAGTFDGIFQGIDPKTGAKIIMILDWKTSSGIYEDYYMQLEAYYRALTEMAERGIIQLEGIKIDKLFIARFDKEERINFDTDIVMLDPKNENRFKAFLGLNDYLRWTQLPKEER